ncbi:MAG: YifB family Mg chelatase-like AAA ATPase [Candidatus Vogelbacteria bacterium]|nr:YifB family Mg chelatase-like AAA ATPase [Candidatus Vogelbacteria bacterium]
MLAKLHTVQTNGLKPSIVDVEVDISRGMHAFSIVGLADKAIGEDKDRIGAAIKNSGFKPITKGSKKIIVSLAPADIKKEGSQFDLAIALGYLLAEGEIKFNPKKKIFLGELSLTGELRSGRGTLLLVEAAQKKGFEEVFLPADNAREAALIRGIKIFPCQSLSEIINHLQSAVKPTEKQIKEEGAEPSFQITIQPETEIAPDERESAFDFADVRGQESAKRGLEIAAAGGHNAAMYGPPGTGKSMLAKAFCGLLPPLSYDEIVEATGIHSVAGTLEDDIVTTPPFRSPHHTSSHISIVGGGAWPKPGEITLAHRGVLFLDEFPEFEKRVVESLRQPLEDKMISISRSKGTMLFPANFILVATMNPCPCGYNNSKTRACTCSASDINRYQKKLSGPIVDRIDLWLDVPQIDHEKLSQKGAGGESSAEIRARVIRARQIQLSRFADAGLKIKTNGEMSIREIVRYAAIDEELSRFLNEAAKKLDLSARAYHRVVKLARTIADLEEASDITQGHLSEALQYRPRMGT